MTPTSRRALLGAGALGAVAATVVTAASGPAVAAATERASGRYSRARFTPLRHRTFRASGLGGHWSMRLTKVANAPHVSHGSQRQFTLTFRSARTGPPQGSYVFRRWGFAETPLFIVPTDTHRRTYVAVVNRAF